MYEVRNSVFTITIRLKNTRFKGQSCVLWPWNVAQLKDSPCSTEWIGVCFKRISEFV